MTTAIPADTVYREGDQIVLVQGTYQGTLGVFVGLREDVKWADIRERNGSLWSHPVAWLALAESSSPLS